MALVSPVIATTGGGTDELVQDGKTGFIIDRQNSSQLIAKMECWSEGSAPLAATIGAQGNKWVRDNLDIKRMTDAYIGLYHRVLNKNSKPSKIGALSAESYS